MPRCRYVDDCVKHETTLDRLEFCLDEMGRGSFRGCVHGFVKYGDTVYSPLREL